jgi:hypothetical protein
MTNAHAVMVDGKIIELDDGTTANHRVGRNLPTLHAR